MNGVDTTTSSQVPETIGLSQFILEAVNIRDEQGDTAVNLTGWARTVLVPQLLKVGVNPHLLNHMGLRPADYSVGVNMINKGAPHPRVQATTLATPHPTAAAKAQPCSGPAGLRRTSTRPTRWFRRSWSSQR